MIKSVKITNYLNDSITMELMNPEKSGFIITKIDGLGPGKATINKTEIANYDGSLYNSARFNSRNIVLGIRFMQYDTESIEDLRQKSYKFFPIKSKVRLTIVTDNREAFIEGYIESNEPNIFSDKEETNISILCPDPYFYSCGEDGDNVTVFSGMEPLFEFPFGSGMFSSMVMAFPADTFVDFNGNISYDFTLAEMHANDFIKEHTNDKTTVKKIKLEDKIICEVIELGDLIEFGSVENKTENTVFYSGDAEVGVVLNIHVLGEVRNITIYNVLTRESISIDTGKLETLTGSGLGSGDDIIISTIKGSKGIRLLRQGIEYNILNTLNANADWFQLAKGDNVFTYTAEYGGNNLQFKITNQVLYEGI